MMTSVGLVGGRHRSASSQPVLLECVLGEANRHCQDCAGDQAGHGLYEPLRHLIGTLMSFAGGVDNQCGERLQEITAESATERAAIV